MLKRSAGVLVFRRTGAGIEVLLAHPGGPFWKNKDEGAWSIPKGEYGDHENPLAAAKRGNSFLWARFARLAKS
jgi:predicted NUDIX family NTP pyrophosphohydrolase